MTLRVVSENFARRVKTTLVAIPWADLPLFLPLYSVSVRVRPLSTAEAEKGSSWKIEGNSIQPVGKDVAEGVYTLDNIFDSTWSTEAVYQHTTKDLVAKVVGGFNGTVFAYGQTSSGKTHTMRGTTGQPGIVPLAVQDVFDHISSTQEREYLLRVSYMEVRPPRYLTKMITASMLAGDLCPVTA